MDPASVVPISFLCCCFFSVYSRQYIICKLQWRRGVASGSCVLGLSGVIVHNAYVFAKSDVTK